MSAGRHTRSSVSQGLPDTLLLTGATGFLGSHLAEQFVRDGYRVLVLKRTHSDTARLHDLAGDLAMYDGEDDGAVRTIFVENRVDGVVHCATNYGRQGVSAADVVETNLILPLRLLQIAAEHGARAFVNTDTILDPRINAYSLSKRQFVDWMEHLAPKLACANVALEHFYGPGDDPTKFVSGIVHDLLDGVESIALTPGEQKRDFIYVADVVDAFRRIVAFTLDAPSGFYSFQVGTSELVTIREFVEKAYALAGSPATVLRFGALPYRDNEVMCSDVDAAPLRRLGWEPRVTLERGLRLTIEAERRALKHR